MTGPKLSLTHKGYIATSASGKGQLADRLEEGKIW